MTPFQLAVAACDAEEVLHPSGPKHLALVASLLPHAERDVASLSACEREVLEALAEGLTNKGIAQRMSVSESTVKSHYLPSMMDKLGVRTRVGLARLWLDEVHAQRMERLMAHIHRSQHKGMPREGCPLCETFTEEKIP